MLDFTVSIMGPDLDPLKEELFDMGRRHIQYGVGSSHLPLMGEAIVEALRELLGLQFSEEDATAWRSVLAFVVQHMQRGMKLHSN